MGISNSLSQKLSSSSSSFFILPLKQKFTHFPSQIGEFTVESLGPQASQEIFIFFVVVKPFPCLHPPVTALVQATATYGSGLNCHKWQFHKFPGDLASGFAFKLKFAHVTSMPKVIHWIFISCPISFNALAWYVRSI